MNSFFENIKECLPKWGPVGWTAVAIAALVLIFTGVSLFYTPSNEVMYSYTRLGLPNTESGGCYLSYSIEVGNTGTKPQDSVRLVFSRQAMNHTVIGPEARDYGVSARRITVSSDETAMTIELGMLEPEKRVRVTFLLSYQKGKQPHTWEETFIRVDPAKGKAKYGDPGMTMVGRAWFGLFGRWLPF